MMKKKLRRWPAFFERACAAYGVSSVKSLAAQAARRWPKEAEDIKTSAEREVRLHYLSIRLQVLRRTLNGH